MAWQSENSGWWFRGKRWLLGSSGVRCDSRISFEPHHVAGGEECPHWGDGDVVVGGEATGRWDSLAGEDGKYRVKMGHQSMLIGHGSFRPFIIAILASAKALPMRAKVLAQPR